MLSQADVIVIGLILIIPGSATIHRINPRENMWVTWANKTGQPAFCLSLASATEPFRTCLLGMPGYKEGDFARFSTGSCTNVTATSNCSANLIKGLNHSLPWNPQELELLGSMRVGNTSKNWTQTCFIFGGPLQTGIHFYQARNWTGWTNVTSHASYYKYQDAGDFCGTNDSGNSYALGAAGAETKGGIGIWNNGTPKALPPQVFLICGDRAWQGIPANAVGGPCYLGKLTLLAPGENWWKTITRKGQQQRRKRAATGLSPDCRDDVILPSDTEKVFLSLFVPGAAAARALNEVGKLACWAKKQADVTTELIEKLLADQDTFHHAILQNRAAIDFLLLAQGHGCEDFEGMCCMNLSDHGESIHKQLQWLKDHTKNIQQDHGLFDTWLKNIFGELPSWIISLIKESLRILIVILVISICSCIIFSCVKKAIMKIVNQVWVAQKQEGGIVEEWLVQQGHDLVSMSNPCF